MNRGRIMEESLYHYTSVDGFYSIIKSKKLRVTRYDFLNDNKECVLFFNAVKAYLQERNFKIKTHKVSDDGQKIIKKYTLDKYIDWLQNHIFYYVLSLTVEKDNLPMWQYYGQNGIQLEFDKEELIGKLKEMLKLKDHNEKVIISGKVSYLNFDKAEILQNFKNEELKIWYVETEKNNESNVEEHEYTENIQKFIDNCIIDLQYSLKFLLETEKIKIDDNDEKVFYELYENSINNPNKEIKFKYLMLINLIALNSLFKINSYKNEQEYRIVVLEKDIHHQTKNDEYYVSSFNQIRYLKPFISLDIELGECLKSVTISPSTKNLPIENEQYKKVIKKFLERQLDKDINVYFSTHDIRW